MILIQNSIQHRIRILSFTMIAFHKGTGILLIPFIIQKGQKLLRIFNPGGIFINHIGVYITCFITKGKFTAFTNRALIRFIFHMNFNLRPCTFLLILPIITETIPNYSYKDYYHSRNHTTPMS